MSDGDTKREKRRIPSKITPVDISVLDALRGTEMLSGLELAAITKAGMGKTYTSLLKLAHMGLVAEVAADEDIVEISRRTYYRLAYGGALLTGDKPPTRTVALFRPAPRMLVISALALCAAGIVVYCATCLFLLQ